MKAFVSILVFFMAMSSAQAELSTSVVYAMDIGNLHTSMSYRPDLKRTQYFIRGNGSIRGLRSNGTVIGQLQTALAFNVWVDDSYANAAVLKMITGCHQMAQNARGNPGSFAVSVSNINASLAPNVSTNGVGLEAWANRMFSLPQDEMILRQLGCEN